MKSATFHDTQERSELFPGSNKAAIHAGARNEEASWVLGPVAIIEVLYNKVFGR